MSIKLQLPKLTDLKPRITVIGVGGAGGNALNNMISAGLRGVEFVAANTDAQALSMSAAEHRLQLGVSLTEGLGAGSKPEVGRAAAEEAIEDIRQQLSGSHMCFIAAGMGGGTGTGAAGVIARVAKELGVLTVGVVTKPFQFEGARRMRMAEMGIAELRQHVDTLIVIPNQNLFRIATERTTFAEAFRLADQVLHSGVACIVDLIVRDGLINLDFADVRTVMSNMGNAMMGTGEASGEGRAIEAAEAAIHNPLIDDVSLKGARGLLLSVTGGRDLTLYEVDEAASRIRREVDPEANIIVGATFDDDLDGKMRVSIVASGIGRPADASQHPHAAPAMSRPVAPSSPPPDASLRQKLFGAMQHDDRTPPRAVSDDDAPLELAEDIAPEAAAPTWKGPGDVTIVEQLPRMARPGTPSPHPDRPTHSSPPAGVENFRPAPPVEPRDDLSRAQRRMPDVADFPPVGQREYRAKAQPPSPSSVVAEPTQRHGFFQRWTSPFQRRRGESPANHRAGEGQYDVQDVAGDIAHPSYGSAYSGDGRRDGAAGLRPSGAHGASTGLDSHSTAATQRHENPDENKYRKV